MSLDGLLGSWDVTMQHVAVTEPVAIRHHFEWVLADAFVMFRSTCQHPDIPDAIALIEQTKYHYFDVRGFTRVFDFQIDDNGWSMIRRDPDFWQRSAVSFVGADAMQGTGENSHDGGASWEHDYTISYARIG
jgi:hypothetical protein